MRPIHKPKTRAEQRFRRHMRVRKRVEGTAERPRLVVYRSLKHIYAQIVDDQSRRTLLTVSDLTNGEGRKAERALVVGKALAERAKAAGVTQVIFDRGGFLFHGRVKALADAAREGGLQF